MNLGNSFVKYSSFVGMSLLLWMPQINSSNAQSRNLPEEIKALSVACSTSAASNFQGELRGGMNRFFGKLVEGEGEFISGRGETEFLSEFGDENLKIEARRIYNECIVSSMKMIYGSKSPLSFTTNNDARYIDITNSRVQFAETLDENGVDSFEYLFKINTECDVIIDFPEGTGFTVGYVLRAASKSKIGYSKLGTNIGPDRYELGPGNYRFELNAKRDAGYYKFALEANC